MLNRMMRGASTMMVVLLGTAGIASAQLTNFSQDVNSSLDAYLDYVRLSGVLTTDEDALGLVGLSLMEKHATAAFGSPILGYSNSSASDRLLLNASAHTVVCSSNHTNRDYFYAYVDGIDQMFLSLYLRTGGPDVLQDCSDWGTSNYTPSEAIDHLVDRTLANQGSDASCSGGGGGEGFEAAAAVFVVSPPKCGLWDYTQPGQDSSTSQYAAGGLAASRGYYLDPCCTGDPGARAPLIFTSLDRAAQAYHDGQQMDAGDGGWGYQVDSFSISAQQTASGTWVSVLGQRDVNNDAVQKALNWQRNRYNYQDNSWITDGWPSYGYFLFSSSKAYSLLEATGTAPDLGNVIPTDPANVNGIGDLPADAGMARLAHIDPAAVGCAFSGPFQGTHPGSCHGPYSVLLGYKEAKRWYFDYAFTILSRQNTGGDYGLVEDGGWGGGGYWADEAYRALVLERSLAGACIDTDGDGVCDTEDNCALVPNNSEADRQLDSDHNGVGDACQAPVCGSATPSIATLWPINKTLQNVAVTGVVGNGTTLTLTINSVMSDEPSDLSDPPGGAHAPDAFILPDSTINLRKDRGVAATNPGNGRVYRIAFTATEANGLMCTGSVDVKAPKTLATPVIMDALIWNATIIH